ncbi:DUF3375 domain-containing protein [Rhodococcus triatomae]|uniref:DUF3375 domain-containing protein n=1 Tax=Rhodococcus triatomae TaxID=300028 RepID=A0A1G8KQ16_9NOCA|nr:DUF3375 domain-containing protein [Rhodococcus triatomae]QNG18990.1 DUF3375 domain-containing protein [Rhodococcus triatomae]QNG25097.1 DUF3375 domain-containing protein [Rhodococcus triatomae]SDI45452.1 Protein of unknown function [Rhodococcus triatomae]
MSATAAVHRLVRQRDAHAGWALLRADNAHAILALLTRHFGQEIRRRPAPELFELLDDDLQELRESGFHLPRTGQGYCTDWVRAGFLQRRADGAAREETLEPTDGAYAAMTFVEGLTAPVSAATESRLATLSTQLQSLARDSDPRSETRMSALRAERDDIDRQITAVEKGEFAVLDGARALERSAEILHLASEVPGDFARVRAGFEELNRDLRARILEDDSGRGDTLGDVFRGVDLIGQSDAGRSFTAFYDTILDPARSSQIDDWIESILARPFAAQLDADQLRRFRRLLTDMEAAAAEVHSTMSSLSRSLRHFVQSRAYEEHRHLQRLLRNAQHKAVDVARVRKPFDNLDLHLIRVGMSIESVAAFALHNPSDDLVTVKVDTPPTGVVDLEELRRLVRESEIDFDELTANVAATLRARGRASVADVLAVHPATQGLASVVGLMALASRYGHSTTDTDLVEWTSTAGITRRAVIRRQLFDPTAAEFRRQEGSSQG